MEPTHDDEVAILLQRKFPHVIELLGVVVGVVPFFLHTATWHRVDVGGKIVVRYSDQLTLWAGVLAALAGVVSLIFLGRTARSRKLPRAVLAIVLLGLGGLQIARALGKLGLPSEVEAELRAAAAGAGDEGGALLARKDVPGALAAYERACASGVPSGCYNAGQIHANLVRGSAGVVPLDKAKASTLWIQACDLGDGDACMNAAAFIDDTDPARSLALQQRGCELHSANACFNLANEYTSGKGIAKDPARAVALYTEACDGGSPDACNQLGVRYASGQDVPQDHAKAVAAWSRSCTAGQMLACFNLGAQHQNGLGVAVSLPRAAELYEKSCAGGYGPGCQAAGELHRDGFGVPKDGARALALFEKGCKLGVEQSCKDARQP